MRSNALSSSAVLRKSAAIALPHLILEGLGGRGDLAGPSPLSRTHLRLGVRDLRDALAERVGPVAVLRREGRDAHRRAFALARLGRGDRRVLPVLRERLRGL